MGNERILVVEDEDHVSKLLAALLEIRGYENVQIANNDPALKNGRYLVQLQNHIQAKGVAGI